MNVFRIKFSDSTTLKQIHEYVIDENYNAIEFIEIDDGVNPEIAFIIANLLKTYTNYYIIYSTFRKYLPTEELSPEIFFRGIPFDEVSLNGKKYYFPPCLKFS